MKDSAQTAKPQNHFIFDPLTGDATIIAVNRAKRPDQTGSVGRKDSVSRTPVSSIVKDSAEAPKPKPCPFCKGNESMTPATLYQDEDDWNVRVFENKFPLLENHEVVVHSPDHDKDIEDLSTDEVVKILRAYLNRLGIYNAEEKEVIIFNNRGGKAGASLMHPHSQVVASKGFPGTIEQEKSSALHYYNSHVMCYWCHEMEKEIVNKQRVVLESKHFVVYVPEACRWSYEMRLLPKKHTPTFAYTTEPELYDLADVLQKVLKAYNHLFDRPDRNFWIHTERYEPYHWHIGFIPHIKVFGALELGAGIWVSDKATSEDAAAQLRDVIATFK